MRGLLLGGFDVGSLVCCLAGWCVDLFWFALEVLGFGCLCSCGFCNINFGGFCGADVVDCCIGLGVVFGGSGCCEWIVVGGVSRCVGFTL